MHLPSFIDTQVLIIGGVTGTALARDLALRGVDCILVEKELRHQRRSLGTCPWPAAQRRPLRGRRPRRGDGVPRRERHPQARRGADHPGHRRIFRRGAGGRRALYRRLPGTLRPVGNRRPRRRRRGGTDAGTGALGTHDRGVRSARRVHRSVSPLGRNVSRRPAALAARVMRAHARHGLRARWPAHPRGAGATRKRRRRSPDRRRASRERGGRLGVGRMAYQAGVQISR